MPETPNVICRPIINNEHYIENKNLITNKRPRVKLINVNKIKVNNIKNEST